MALISITTKVAGSATYDERKVLINDINQIKEALQTGIKDIKPLNCYMEGTLFTFNGVTAGFRYNTGTNKMQVSNDGSTWADIEAADANLTTVTAGENIAIRDLVYIKSSDGLAYKAQADGTTSEEYDWIGVASAAITAAASGTIYTQGAIAGGFSALTAGEWQYLSTTAGSISTTGIVKVGIAISTTQIILLKDAKQEEFVRLDAGESITAGDVVYINKDDGEAYVSDSSTHLDRRADGLAINSASAASMVVIQTRGTFLTTGLTTKKVYYLGATGAVSTTYSSVQVGRTISATELWIDINDNRDARIGVIEYCDDDLSGAGLPTAYWALMDGTTISDAESPINGQTLRDMNAGNEILRAGDASGANGGSSTHTHGIAIAYDAYEDGGVRGIGTIQGTNVTSTVQTNSTSTYPPYYEAVAYMKIK